MLDYNLSGWKLTAAKRMSGTRKASSMVKTTGIFSHLEVLTVVSMLEYQ